MAKRRRKSREIMKSKKADAQSKKFLMTLAIVGAVFILFLILLQLSA